MPELLDQSAIDDGLAPLNGEWTGNPGGLHRSIEFADFLTAVRFISLVAPKCESLDHHPDLDLRWRRVDISVVSHSAGGVTAKDLQLAEVVDQVAASLPLAE